MLKLKYLQEKIQGGKVMRWFAVLKPAVEAVALLGVGSLWLCLWVL